MTDFAASCYYARSDGTEDDAPDVDDLTPLTAALDRTEAAMTAPAPRTDTDAALTRIQAIARLGGIVLTVTEGWDGCWCEVGTHPWFQRHHHLEDEVTARAWVQRGPDRHVVRNHRLDGYTAWEVR